MGPDDECYFQHRRIVLRAFPLTPLPWRLVSPAENLHSEKVREPAPRCQHGEEAKDKENRANSQLLSASTTQAAQGRPCGQQIRW